MLTNQNNKTSPPPSFAVVLVALLLAATVLSVLVLWFTANPDYLSQLAACQNNTKVELGECLSFNTEVSVWRFGQLIGLHQ